MKVILSRKCIDSSYGFKDDNKKLDIYSPILENGVMLPIPIPRPVGKRYDEIFYNDISLKDIITQLNKGNKRKCDFAAQHSGHLDPDICSCYDVKQRGVDWKPAYGSSGNHAKHLDNNDVKPGDIFLFYGTFRETVGDPALHTLSYKPASRNVHAIYGFLEIDKILNDYDTMRKEYPWHAHADEEYNKNHKDNRLYTASRAGTLNFSKNNILTNMEQKNKGLWKLPEFFADPKITITYHEKERPVPKNGYAELNSSDIGQEFVISTENSKLERELHNWIENVIQGKM